MQSSYLELAKQGTNKLQSYCYVLFSLILLTFLYFGFILIFSELEWKDLNDQNFQLETYLPSDPILYFFIWLPGWLAITIIFLFLFKKLHHRKIITLINTKDSIRWRHIYVGFTVWFILIIVRELINFTIDPSRYTFSTNFNNWISIDILLLSIITFFGNILSTLFNGYILQGIYLMIQKPLILILAISTLSGLGAAQSVESWSWGQNVFLGFCYSLFCMWLIYKDNGLELNFSISLATSFAGLIIQEQKTSTFINFSPLLIVNNHSNWTIELISNLLMFFIFYLIYLYFLRREKSMRNQESLSQ